MKKLMLVALVIATVVVIIIPKNNVAVTTTANTSKIKVVKVDEFAKVMNERKEMKKVVIKQYKNNIVVSNKIKTKDKSKEISRSKNNPKLRAITVIATSYAPYDNKSGICNDGSPNTTSTGSKPKWGCIAVDPKEIPYGTKLLIPTYNDDKICTAEDTGGALRRDKKNIRIDLYMDTYEQAMNWGVREIVIYIVED